MNKPTVDVYSAVNVSSNTADPQEDTEYDVTSHVQTRDKDDQTYSNSLVIDDVYNQTNNQLCKDRNEMNYDHVGDLVADFTDSKDRHDNLDTREDTEYDVTSNAQTRGNDNQTYSHSPETDEV